MKVLQILPELRVGGVETGTVDLCRYFVEHGHQALVVSNGGELVDDVIEAGGQHIQLPVHQKNLLTMIFCFRQLVKVLKKENVDIVHARSRVPAWIAFFACRVTRTPFVTTCHGYYSRHFFSRVMGWGKLVIVPSSVIGRHMIEDFSVTPEHLRCIARSVDLRKFHFSSNKDLTKTQHTIAIIGRITPLKGHDYFLHAMARVIRTKPYTKIWIIGDAPEDKAAYLESLRALTRKLGLHDQVEFLGNRKDIPDLLKEIDVVVFSSVVPESFGRVIIEAQAAGVPVVATRVGGVVDIIRHEHNGLLIESRQPEQMAQAVIRLMDDKDMMRQIIKNAREKILSEYTLDHMAEATMKVYEEVIDHINILVIKLSALGDVILATPSLKALKKKFPLSKIYCLVKKDFREVVQACPYIEDLIIYDPEHKHKNGWWGIWKLSKKLYHYQFDKVIDFQNSRKSHLLSFLTFCPERYGYRNQKWGFLLNYGIKDVDKSVDPVAHQFRILNLLGIELTGKERLELWSSSKDRIYIEQILESQWIADHAILIGIQISASGRWRSKAWPLDHIAQLCDLLAAKNIRVVLTGSSSDQGNVRQLLKLTKAKPADLTGKTNIAQLFVLLKKCHAFVAMDSAPLHIAAAANVPVVALFGPTDPLRHMPPVDKGKILYRSLSCSPCYSPSCLIKTHACLRQIKPLEVAQAIEEMI